MLVSVFARDSDTNKYTSKLGGYQQTGANYGEEYTLQFALIFGTL